MLLAYKQNDLDITYDFSREFKAMETVRRQTALYYMKQKLSGVCMIILAIIAPILLEGDGTASIIFMPLGVYLLVTKKKVMDFKGK